MAASSTTKPCPSYHALPLELRQTILLHTYSKHSLDHYLKIGSPIYANLLSSTSQSSLFLFNRESIKATRFKLACGLVNKELLRIQNWTNMLKQVDAVVGEDVRFVVKTWVKEVMEVVEEVKKKFDIEGQAWRLLWRTAQGGEERYLEQTLRVLMD
jgi:hypothetical protein